MNITVQLLTLAAKVSSDGEQEVATEFEEEQNELCKWHS